MKNLATQVIYVLVIIFFPVKTWADIQLPEIFSNHMVLQRGIPIPIWGTADSDAPLEISLNQSSITTKADYFGNWKAVLPPMEAGGAYELTIQSKNETVIIEDIYIGEVWLCSGQSNMEWPLRQTIKGETEISKSNFPLIRFFHLKKKHDTYKTPYSKEQLIAFSKGRFFHQAKWELCSPETSAAFSGVGYFFGKEIADSLNVPIGLIQAAVGGSPAQSWVSKEALLSHPQLKHLVDGTTIWLNSDIIHPWLAERAKENWANWEKTGNDSLPGHPFAPHYLFDAAIKPLAPYPIRGAIWYQGESNATHPQSYPAMFEMLLQSWRNLWGQGDFPVYFVQLPRIGNRSRWPEFRQAQQECLSNSNTGMIVTIDQGHPTDVHPKEKAIIGKRLARLALVKTYHQNIIAESTMLSSYTWHKEECTITLRFENFYDGLALREGNMLNGIFLQGYKEYGGSETIMPLQNIVIAKSKLIITYPHDFLPTKIKYAWAPYPKNNLVNSAGLPLAPFKIELEGSN